MKYFYTPYPDATNMHGVGKLTAIEHVDLMQAKSHAQAWVGKYRARWCEEHAQASGRYGRGTRTQVQAMRTYGRQCKHKSDGSGHISVVVAVACLGCLRIQSSVQGTGQRGQASANKNYTCTQTRTLAHKATSTPSAIPLSRVF